MNMSYTPANRALDTSPLYINPFPNKPLLLFFCSTTVLKTLREKEKLLITSNFSFPHSAFFSFGELCANFIKLKIVSLEESKNLSFWKVLRQASHHLIVNS